MPTGTHAFPVHNQPSIYIEEIILSRKHVSNISLYHQFK